MMEPFTFGFSGLALRLLRNLRKPMKHCDIQGCKESISEVFASKRSLGRWLELRACQCGAWRGDKSCVCGMDSDPKEHPIPTQYWPHLDWWALGGVERIVLCPQHRDEVLKEIIKQRQLDPSMNSEKFDRGNVH
jgi:hypothetical protein